MGHGSSTRPPLKGRPLRGRGRVENPSPIADWRKLVAVDAELPPLDEIGRDLLVVPVWRRALSLAFPFALVPLFFLFAAHGWWIAALACPVILSFVTYGSVSHDLVHRTMHLPHWLNETLLCAMMIAGTWIFPIVTVIIPHDARGTSELTRTRLFRGKVLSLLAVEHLYHLEHHLYPQVPHHNWPVLAKRLDPHFARLGLKPLKLFW